MPSVQPASHDFGPVTRSLAVRFLTHFHRISWMTELGGPEAKENPTEEVPMPPPPPFSPPSALLLSSSSSVCVGKEGKKKLQPFTSHEFYFEKGGGGYGVEFVVFTLSLREMVILCIFVLLYRHFVIKQDETHNHLCRE